MKINQNLIRWSILGQGQQSCQKWKKSKKLLKCYHVNKNLRLAAAAAYEPAKNIKSPPANQGDLLSGEPDYFGRNEISSGGDLSHYSSASLY